MVVQVSDRVEVGGEAALDGENKYWVRGVRELHTSICMASCSRWVQCEEHLKRSVARRDQALCEEERGDGGASLFPFTASSPSRAEAIAVLRSCRQAPERGRWKMREVEGRQHMHSSSWREVSSSFVVFRRIEQMPEAVSSGVLYSRAFGARSVVD